MSTADILARVAAITALIFLMAWILLRFASVAWSGVSPLSHALLFSLLTVASAGLPLLVVHLAYTAMGGSAQSDAGRGRYFTVFTVLAPICALLFAWLLAFGHVRL